MTSCCPYRLTDSEKVYASMKRGMSIVIEGNDGTGKSTLVHNLAHQLTSQYGIESYIIDEPDGEDSICHEIRTLIKNGTVARTPKVNVLLFAASRAQSYVRGNEALNAGKWLLKARDKTSTEVYQGIGEGVDIDDINTIMRFATDEAYMSPDLRVILTASDQTRRERIAQRGELKTPDTFEMRTGAFQEKLSQGYDYIASRDHLPTINAEQSQEAMLDDMLTLLRQQNLLTDSLTHL